MSRRSPRGGDPVPDEEEGVQMQEDPVRSRARGRRKPEDRADSPGAVSRPDAEDQLGGSADVN